MSCIYLYYVWHFCELDLFCRLLLPSYFVCWSCGKSFQVPMCWRLLHVQQLIAMPELSGRPLIDFEQVEAKQFFFWKEWMTTQAKFFDSNPYRFVQHFLWSLKMIGSFSLLCRPKLPFCEGLWCEAGLDMPVHRPGFWTPMTENPSCTFQVFRCNFAGKTSVFLGVGWGWGRTQKGCAMEKFSFPNPLSVLGSEFLNHARMMIGKERFLPCFWFHTLDFMTYILLLIVQKSQTTTWDGAKTL